MRNNGVLPPHPQNIRALKAVAQAYELDSATYISLPILKSVVHLTQKTFKGGDAHPNTTLYRLRLMRALSRDDDECPAKTIRHAENRLKLAMEIFDKQHTQTIYCMNELAEALLVDARKKEALLVTYEALELGLPLRTFSHHITSRLWKNFLTAHNRVADSEQFQAKLKEVLLPHLEKRGFRTFAKGADPEPLEKYRLEAAFAAIERLTLSSWVLGSDHDFTKSMKDEVKSLIFFPHADMKPIVQQFILLKSVELPQCEDFNLASYVP